MRVAQKLRQHCECIRAHDDVAGGYESRGVVCHCDGHVCSAHGAGIVEAIAHHEHDMPSLLRAFDVCDLLLGPLIELHPLAKERIEERFVAIRIAGWIVGVTVERGWQPWA